jgi:hypothetical protein
VTNFDFLKPGSPHAPADVEVRPPRYRTWGWSVEVTPWYAYLGKNSSRHNETEYSLACLTDDDLYIRTGYKNATDRTRAIAELNAFEPPAVLKSNYKRYPLASIYRLRYSDSVGALDIVNFDDRSEQIVDETTKQTGMIFESLRQRLAPNAPIDTEDMRGWRNLKAPLASLSGTSLFAGSLIYLALTYDPGRPRRGRGQLVHDAIGWLVESLGLTGVIGLAVAAILVSFAFVVYRIMYPLQMQSVILKR